MFRSKKLLTSSLTTILLSSTCAYAVDPAPVRARSVELPPETGLVATFSNGVGLDRGNIPITAVGMGYFLIPNGNTRNPTLVNDTAVTFQKVGANWTAYVNGVALAGQGRPVYFSKDALNPAGRNNMRIVNGQAQWEDLENGDNDYNDATLNLSVPRTEMNDTSQLVFSNGAYPIPLIIRYKVNQTGVASNAGFNNSIGHFFFDAAGNPLSGYIDFANIKASIGATSTHPYSGNDPFGAGSTLQYKKDGTAVADVVGTNILAADVSTITGAGAPILKIQESAKLGSVVNTINRTDNLLSVQISSGKTLTITGTAGILYNGKSAPINTFNGLKEIKGLTVDTAIVEFANPDFEIILNSPVGKDGKLQKLRMLNRSVELKKELDTTNIEFTNPNQISALKLTGGVDLGSTNIITSSTQRIHNIWVNGDQNLSGNIGTANNPFGIFKILNSNTIKVNTQSFYSDVYTLTSNTGTVEFIKAGGISYSLGENERYLSLIKFTENAEVRGSAHSKNISVAAGKTGSFKKRLNKTGQAEIPLYIQTTAGFLLEGVGSTAFIGNEAEIFTPVGSNGNIITGIANEGVVTFEGSAKVRVDIGTASKRIKEVNYAANDTNKTVILARNVHAETINMSKATYNVERGGIFDGNINANSPTINFGQHVEIFKGGQTTFSGDPVFNVYFDNVSNSHLTITDKGSNLNLSPVTSLTFNITDNSTLPPANGRTYYFFRVENGATMTQIDPVRVRVNQYLNPFIKWTYAFGNLKQTRDIENGLRTIVAAAGGDPNSIPAALLAVDPDSNGSASKFIQNLIVRSPSGLVAAGESARRVIQATNPTGIVAINTSQSALSSIVSARVNNAQLFQFRLSEASGVAAGSEVDIQRGVWVSPFINQASQKVIGKAVGYKSKAYGGSLGFDGRVSDNLMLGLAGTFLNTTINYKDIKIGDKTKIDTFLGSIYGLYNLPQNFFTQGIFSAAWNTVKNSKIRSSFGFNEIARSKYYSQTYGAEMLMGYDYKNFEWLNMIPLGGFRYGRFIGDKYVEKGTQVENLHVNKKTVEKIEAILGLKVATIKHVKDYVVIPEVHGFVNYDLKPRAPKVYIKLEGMDEMRGATSKPARTLYNLGGALIAKRNAMEYEVSYDSNISKKYIAHQGTLKIRVNF